eukprot:753020-Hanusia_phi.AAC.2
MQQFVGEEGDMSWLYILGMLLVIVFFINWYFEQMEQVRKHDARKKRQGKVSGIQSSRLQPRGYDRKSTELKKND